MFTRWRLGTPLRLSLLFVLVAGTLLATLAWLWQALLADERRVDLAQQTERLNNAATLLSHEIERSLAMWEAQATSALRDPRAAPPSGVALLVFNTEGVIRTAGVRLPFVPAVTDVRVPSSDTLSLAAAEEFQHHDLSKAASLYRQAARTVDRSVRAAALLGLARAMRKQQQTRAAAAVYADLAQLGDTPVAGFPAALLARRERSALLQLLGDEPGSRDEADRLRAALLEGTFLIDRATFDLFSSALPGALPERPALILANAATELWPTWQRGDGRSNTTVEGRAMVTTWRTGGRLAAALVGPIDALLSSTLQLTQDLGVQASLETTTGESAWGRPTTVVVSADRSLRDIGLPWTLSVVSPTTGDVHASWMSRRNLLTAGFLLMALVIAAASYAVYRSVDRELAVARLQSDFVAAVSHEFRSPLTAMRHMTEMLEEGGAAADQVPRYYEALARETRRLHGLVEHLLDFGSMQAGRREYRLEPVDAATLAREVVEECRPHATSASHQLECLVPAHAVTTALDRAAIALALRNLVDNAVKYSPGGSTVVISVTARGDRMGIGVEDHGDGILPSEQRGIFHQFVRGSSARSRHIKGTGIGLTMADRIVRAHGGQLVLKSEAGKGSTFTMWLPFTQTLNETRVSREARGDAVP